MARATFLLLFLAPILFCACKEETRPVAAVPVDAQEGPTWFSDAAASRGIDFTLGATLGSEPLLPEIVAGGGAAIDIDDDGWMDLYLLQATAPEGNVLLRNNGDGTFQDISEGSGARDTGFGMGAATGDYDGDGDMDIYISNHGPNTLLRNNGDGTFTDVSTDSGTSHPGFGASATFFDGDQDGDLDLFVTNYVDWALDRELECRSRTGELEYCAPVNYESPSADVLYRNNGDGTFTDISSSSGIADALGNGLGVVARDFNGDQLQDIFVANDGNPDRLWINLGSMRFKDAAMQLGCDRDISGTPKAGMGVVGEDIDDDGDIDLLVCNLVGETDSLFINQNGRFTDATGQRGLAAVSRGFTRFGIGLVDFDNDSQFDLFEANGRVGKRAPAWADDPYAEPNLLFRGAPDGQFQEVSPRGGVKDQAARTSRGAIFLDIDNDGGQDILVINREAPARLLVNEAPARGNWVMLDIRNANGAPAIGAHVTARLGERTIHRHVHTDGSYLTGNDPRLHIGLGDAESLQDVRVIWPDGSAVTMSEIPAGSIMRIDPEG